MADIVLTDRKSPEEIYRQIKGAIRKKLKEWHPDTSDHPGAEEVTRMLTRLDGTVERVYKIKKGKSHG